MTQTVTVDEYSCSSLLIQMNFENQPLSVGSAFVFQSDEKLYLITNWHNLSGKNPLTGKCLASSAAQPNKLIVMMHVDGKLGSWEPQTFDLVDDNQQPLWYEHMLHGNKIDVVALPISCPSDISCYPINKMPFSNDMAIRVGGDIFILGFPFGLKLTGAFPVWKRASIATEPEIGVEGLPKFMVDTASRPGMSGSPVIRREYGQYQCEDGSLAFTLGAPTRFLGVYSGRVGADDELKAQLGIVWKGRVVEEIISEGVRGSR